MLLSKVRHEDGLLCLPRQTGWSFFNRFLMATHEIGPHIRLDRMESHTVSLRIM